MFASLSRSITRAYVALAVVLILAIVAASTALAFLLYARGMNDAVASAAQRASEIAGRLITPAHPLAQVAPRLAASVGRSRFRVLVLDDRGRPLAQNERRQSAGAGRAVVIAIGRLVGLPRVQVPIAGGTIAISADFDRFGQILLWYWSIMLPIGALGVLAAWLIGRRITARAVVPLAEVTQALRVVAAGDFSPRRLLSEGNNLWELTNAYNDVAYSLATATAERRQTEAQMRQFIADAGHELRTPLTIIMGYLDVLRQGIVQGSEGTQRTYETMLDESRKMRSIIEKLILLARLDRAPAATRPVPVDLNAVAQRAADALHPLANGRIRTDAAAGSAIVTADESELYEAVKNLVDNALKYAPKSDVRIDVTSDSDAACISVSDSGPGMEPEDAEHAFDRFYRGAHGEIDGSGLGLAIARRAVERAHGTARLETAPGKGTRVTLCLPREQQPNPVA